MPRKRSRRVGKVSRRVFLHRLTFVGGALILGGSCKKEQPPPAPAKKPPGALVSSHRTFTNEEFAVVSAACERLLPKDQDPGALEANVPEYIDRALATPELKGVRERFLAGSAALNRRSERMFKVGFAQATPEQQDELLGLFRDSPPASGELRHYEDLLALTLEGFLGDPSYGGNRGKVGWALMGFTVVGDQAAEPPSDYDGLKHLHTRHGGH